MSTAMTKMLLALAILAFTQNGQPKKHVQSDAIEGSELSVYIGNKMDCQMDQIGYSQVERHDFLGVGYDQVVVVASSCQTGTAGPDVHSVFARDENGELKELAMQEVKPDQYVLFGNPNSEFRIENDTLTEVYRDTSGRDEPLVVEYKWDKAKEQFVIVSMKLPPVYKTSYDCRKAEKQGDETAEAICYVKSLADLDVELAQVYRSYLSGLGADQRKAAVEEQRAWLKKRNDQCDIYKWWVDCLTDSYNERIGELKKKVEERKKNSNVGSSGAKSQL